MHLLILSKISLLSFPSNFHLAIGKAVYVITVLSDALNRQASLLLISIFYLLADTLLYPDIDLHIYFFFFIYQHFLFTF